MTITNSSIQSALLTADVSVDSAMAGQTSTIEGHISGQGKEMSDGEFWSMLSHNLSGLVAGNDSQAIENKDLLSVLKAFEAELEAGRVDVLPGAWMQYLKSHFSELLEPSPLESQADESAKISELLDVSVGHAAESEDVEPMVALPLAGGDLPPGRQTVTVSSGTADEVVLPLQISRTDKMPQDAELPHQPMEQKPFVLSETNRQEIPFRQAVDYAMMKTAAVIPDGAVSRAAETLTPVLQPMMNTVNPQPLNSSQVLPAEFQSLSLALAAGNQQWGTALGEKVAFLINHKLNSAEIRMDPPHLGKLDIQIQVKDDAALVVINTSQAQTRDLVENASIRLREFLQEAGYSSVDVNVSHQESSAEQGLAGNDANDGNLQGNDQSVDDSVVDETAMQAATMVIDDGRIDYFA